MARYLKGELVSVLDAVDRAGQPIGVMLIGTDEWDDRVLPIIIGNAETLSIRKGLGEIDFPRPLSHDLFVEILEALGAAVEKITIDAMINGTYTATIYIRDASGKVHSFDSRPSDAVALAVRVNAPIYVSDSLAELTEDASNYIRPPSGKIEE
ncbi:MAG: bifunctional nuclease family protein [Thermoproteus sp.]|nr:bifunctional nuclease family protein [Thermoproteus sp.]